MNWEDVLRKPRRYDNQPTRKNTSAAKEHAFRRNLGLEEYKTAVEQIDKINNCNR